MMIMIERIARIAEAGYVNAAKPEYCSFDFTGRPGSITPVMAAALAARIDAKVVKVGTFAGVTVQKIADTCKKGVINAVQLVGGEDDSYIERLRGYTDAPVIKTVQVRGGRVPLSAKADFMMLDFTGMPFSPLATADLRKPWFLTGGVKLGNLKEAAALGARCVCLREGVETNGFKDWEKIAAIMEAARKSEA